VLFFEDRQLTDKVVPVVNQSPQLVVDIHAQRFVFVSKKRRAHTHRCGQRSTPYLSCINSSSTQWRASLTVTKVAFHMLAVSA
jgi:hypothetical protein